MKVVALEVEALVVVALSVVKYATGEKIELKIPDPMLAIEAKRLVEEAVVEKELVEVELVMVALVPVRFRTERIFAKRVLSTFRLVIDEVAAIRELVLRLVEVELVIVPLEDERLVLEILVAERLVEVEFVIVPLVELIEESEMFPAERLVMVAEVSVAFPPPIFAVVMLAVEIFEVVELVVDARSVAN